MCELNKEFVELGLSAGLNFVKMSIEHFREWLRRNMQIFVIQFEG